MLFKKKEEPTEEPIVESAEEQEEEVREEPKPLPIPDIFDYAEWYINQLRSDVRTGAISQELYDCEMERIQRKIEELKEICADAVDENFTERVRKVIESIFNERSKQ